jgi:hypothetical protein
MMEQPESLRFGGATDLEGRKRWLAERWHLFRNHRRQITEILCALAGASDQHLAVFGAGACLDIDLSKLTSAYGCISLVDADGEALDYASLLQQNVDFGTIHPHSGVDLTGLHESFEQWRKYPPDDAAIADAMTVAACHQAPELDGGFHVVLSDCMLSQIIEQIVLAMGESHPQLLKMISKIRQRHLELLLSRTAPGGHVVVVSDMVSSLTASILQTTPPEKLAQLMDALIQRGDFFTGCNPYAIKSSCERQANMRRRIKTISLTHPWLWHLTHDRTQLVYCLIMETHPA